MLLTFLIVLKLAVLKTHTFQHVFTSNVYNYQRYRHVDKYFVSTFVLLMGQKNVAERKKDICN